MDQNGLFDVYTETMDNNQKNVNKCKLWNSFYPDKARDFMYTRNGRPSEAIWLNLT